MFLSQIIRLRCTGLYTVWSTYDGHHTPHSTGDRETIYALHNVILYAPRRRRAFALSPGRQLTLESKPRS